MKKVTLRQIIANINFDDKNMQDDVNWEDLMSDLDIDHYGYWYKQERLKVYFIKKWYCTDSYVGIRAYFLDGELVSTSYKGSRKSDESFKFVSVESANKTREYVLSLIPKKEPELSVSLLNLDEELDEMYQIEYNTQIMHKSAWLNGEKVTILKKNFEKEGLHSPNFFHSVEVLLPNSEKQIVDCRELRFEYNNLD